MYILREISSKFDIFLEEDNDTKHIATFEDRELCDKIVRNLNREKYKYIKTDLGELPLYVIINELIDVLKSSTEFKLKKATLFGSYARGDFRDSSDVDIHIIADCKDKKELRKLLSSIGSDFMDKYCINIFMMCDTEQSYLDDNTRSIYTVIRKEGIILYE